MKKIFFIFSLTFFFLFFLSTDANAISSGNCQNRSPECSDKTLFPDSLCKELDQWVIQGCSMSNFDPATRGCSMKDGNKYFCAYLNPDNVPPPAPPEGYNCTNRDPRCPSNTYPVCRGPIDPPVPCTTCQFFKNSDGTGGRYCADPSPAPPPGGTAPCYYCTPPKEYRTSSDGTAYCLGSGNTKGSTSSCTLSAGQVCDRSKGCIDSAGTGTAPPDGTAPPGSLGTPLAPYNAAVGCGNSPNSVWTLDCIFPVLGRIVNWALAFAGVVALILIIYSGIRFTASGGDQKNIDTAKKILTYAIAGLVLVLVSFAIINLITYATGASCINRFGFNVCL